MLSQREPTSSSYESVMIFYMAIGAVGLLFVAAAILSEYGLLEAAVKTIFGEQSEAVLQNLHGLGVFLTFGLGFYLVVGWIPAIWITIRYRKMWPIWAPSAMFLLVEVLVLATIESNWATQSSYEWIMGIVIALYFLVTFFVGIQMFSRRKRTSMPSGSPGA